MFPEYISLFPGYHNQSNQIPAKKTITDNTIYVHSVSTGKNFIIIYVEIKITNSLYPACARYDCWQMKRISFLQCHVQFYRLELFVNYSNRRLTESIEIPPLPVSSTKFKLSLNSSNVACKIIIPPVNWVNGIVVMNFAGGGTNSSCAKSEVLMKKKIIERYKS